MKRPSYIEFIGLPGAGKSTAAKLLVDHLRKEGVVSRQRIPLKASLLRKMKVVCIVLVLLLRSPDLFALWIFPIAVKYRTISHVRSVVKNVRSRFFAEVAIVRSLLKEEKEILVNDEGLIGKMVVFSLLTGMSEQRMFEILLKTLPRHTFVIYVEMPTSVAIKRVLERDIHIPFIYDMDAETRMDFYTRNAEVYSSVCSRLQKIEHIKIACIANTGTEQDLQHAIGRVI